MKENKEVSMSNLLEELKYRDLVYQQTDEEGIKKLLETESVSIYCGTDPTGDSLHVGHLLPFLTLKRFAKYGHKPVVLVGGGTGIIGDPSGRSEERQLQSLETIAENAKKLENQLRNIFRGDENIEFVNNGDWLGKMSMIEFLRDYGKLINVNYMLAKDSVSSRLENGLSFTEFSYTLLQGIDYAYLNEHHGVKMQLGGSDQWGNITTGLEIMRKLRGDVEAYGFTIPLMLKSDGTKFGKSTGGAVWLDPEKTTPYEFYQFWFNTADNDTISAIKKFTFLEKEEIEKLEESLAKEPHLRLAQKALAEELVKIVHGEAALESALNITKALFSGNIKELTLDELKEAVKGMPKAQLPKDDINIVDFLVESGVVTSKRQAREDVNNGAVSINGDKVTDLAFTVDSSSRLEDSFTVVRRGKKNYKLVEYK
jgi:tyrosine--tRNA ligase